MTAFSADRRLRNLDNRLLVMVAFVTEMALYLFGALQSEYAYGDTRFAIGCLTTELQVAAFLLVVTVVFLPARRIGFRRPQRGSGRELWPFAVFMLIAMGAWIAARLSVPPDALKFNETAGVYSIRAEHHGLDRQRGHEILTKAVTSDPVMARPRRWRGSSIISRLSPWHGVSPQTSGNSR